jgi:uncharacterized protein
MIKMLCLQVNGEALSVKRFEPQDDPPLWGALYLHGAGSSTKERGDALCQALSERQVSAVSFDFSGGGQSTSCLPCSLQKRADEASAVLEQLLLPTRLPLVVLAFSMSGQVAMDLLSKFGNQIKCLALFNPAIYDSRARAVPFGPEFSAIIRQEGSWKKSDIAVSFESYQGITLLVKSEHDDVIPPEVYDLIRVAAPASSVSLIEIGSAPHQLGAFLNEHPQVTADLADRIVGLLEAHADAAL